MEMLIDGPAGTKYTLVLAHGAGAPMDSPFMETIASGLAKRGLRCVRFEFPYMQERRQSGRRRPPDSAAKLQACWLEVIEELGDPDSLVIGGKSLGGRIASMVADGSGVAGLVCLGYPFHAPGRPENPRTGHLEALATPTLILQGARDALGGPSEIALYSLSPAIRLVYLEDGDHSFKPRKSSCRTVEQNLEEAVEAILTFVDQLAGNALH
jgi:predicted alpha/beta-hydrolase family hydrolase